MINLESGGLIARYFIWSCDHLPFTTGWYTVEEAGEEIARRRTGAYYVERGTTLCHIFWAIFWVPLIHAAFASIFLFVFSSVHVIVHDNFIREHPYSGPFVSAATYFLPEAFAIGIALAVGSLILAVIGGSKVGFFSLLWQYLKGVKQRICPLVRFGQPSP